MSRKNGNVRRSNARGRLPRRVKGEGRPPKSLVQPRIELETMVIPDGKCFFRSKYGKAIFFGEEKAQAALKQAQAMRRRSGSGHMEKRFYSCPEGGCGGFHLTSRDEYDDSAWKRTAS